MLRLTAETHEIVLNPVDIHLPYVPDPPPGLSTEDHEVYQRIKARRAADNLPLLGIDLSLLHAPKVADGMSISRCFILKVFSNNFYYQ